MSNLAVIGHEEVVLADNQKQPKFYITKAYNDYEIEYSVLHNIQ